jgi:hypothetical protein
MSATLQTMSITVVNLQENRGMFRIFIAFLRFSFDSLVGLPANIKSRTCRKEIRNLTIAASLLCPNTAMAHNTKYRHTEEYYYRVLLKRQTGKQRNDEHNALYHPSYLLNEGQREHQNTERRFRTNAVFFSPTIANITFSNHSHIFNTTYDPAKQREN